MEPSLSGSTSRMLAVVGQLYKKGIHNNLQAFTVIKASINFIEMFAYVMFKQKRNLIPYKIFSKLNNQGFYEETCSLFFGIPGSETV